MKPIHIIAGLLALLSGAVALYAPKGSPLHRRSGMVFFFAMLVMTSSAVLMASLLRPNRINVVAGVVTFYLICTGLLTVRRPLEQIRGLSIALMSLAMAASAYAFTLGMQAVHSAAGVVDGIPAPPIFMFAVVAGLGALLDARMLLDGRIEGRHRLARHLWRMSFAMWIATMSFFLGQARFFPTPVRKSGVLAVPVVLVLIAMIYWLQRVLRKKTQGKVRISTQSTSTTGRV